MSNVVVVSVRMTPELIDYVDDAIEDLGGSLQMFPGGPPSRNQMIRLALVTGLETMGVCGRVHGKYLKMDTTADSEGSSEEEEGMRYENK